MQHCAGHVRFFPNGKLAGFDLHTVLSVAATLGYDAQVLLLLAEYAAAGLQEAVKNHGNGNTECFDPDIGH